MVKSQKLNEEKTSLEEEDTWLEELVLTDEERKLLQKLEESHTISPENEEKSPPACYVNGHSSPVTLPSSASVSTPNLTTTKARCQANTSGTTPV